eukprot:jgi/Undpi1/4213/HiC_scaffold_16.g07579.m1
MPPPRLQRPASRIRPLSAVAPARGLDVKIYDEISEKSCPVKREARDPYRMYDPDLYPRCDPEDHVKKKNCENNPRCLYGLGEGKEGIWSSSPALIKALGPDISGALKAVPASETPPDASASTSGYASVASPPPPGFPSGLRNLGATCYLNSQLQALFANRGFRRGVYAWRPPGSALGSGFAPGSGELQQQQHRAPTSEARSQGLSTDCSPAVEHGDRGVAVSAEGGAPAGVEGFPEKLSAGMRGAEGGTAAAGTEVVTLENDDDKIMEELQRVFGHMQEGVAKVYDPARFASLLGIDNGIQQDPQEFNKLLMSLLERCLQRSAPPLRTLVSGLFCGELAYVTRCLTCKTASRNRNAFNDMELQIGSNRTVETCLDSFLQRESLDGDNQYLCEQCGLKRDAVRAIELIRLPAVLSIQLLRYVYSAKTGQRKKITAAVSLPLTLDMGPRLGPQGEDAAGTQKAVVGAKAAGGKGVGGDGEGGGGGGASSFGHPDSVYDLACVLYHKGTNVHSGHYIAEADDSDGVADSAANKTNGEAESESGVGRGKGKRKGRGKGKGGKGRGKDKDAGDVDSEGESGGGKEKRKGKGKGKKVAAYTSTDDEYLPNEKIAKGAAGKRKSRAKVIQRPKRNKTVEEISEDEEEDIDVEGSTGTTAQRDLFSSPSFLSASANCGPSSLAVHPMGAAQPMMGAAQSMRAVKAEGGGGGGGGAGATLGEEPEACSASSTVDVEVLDAAGGGGEEDGEGEEGGEAGESGVGAAGGGKSKGKRQRGSEDAYMLIYVRRGVAWGPGRGDGDKSLLSAGVLAAVEASNAALAKSVSDFHERRRCVEDQMRVRRERYCRLFGAPAKSARPPRKGLGEGRRRRGKWGVGRGEEEGGRGGGEKEEERGAGGGEGARRGGQADVFVHPGPSDNQLGRTLRIDGTTSIAAEEPPSQEDRDLARALAASLATSAPSSVPPSSCSSEILSSSTTTSCSASSSKHVATFGSAAASDQPATVVPPGDFFWVDSSWLKQWSDGERLGMGGEVSGAAANGREASGGGSRGREAAGGGEPGESVATLERAGQGPDPQKARKEEEHEKDEARGGKGREGGALASSPAPLPSEGGVFVDPMRHLPLVCRHGGLHPASVARLKLVSRAVYLGLLAEEGMPPPDRHLAASNYYCAVCVGDHIRRKEVNVTASRESGDLVALLEKPEPPWVDGDGLDGRPDKASPLPSVRPFAISRKWVAELKLYHDQFLRSAAKSAANQPKRGAGAHDNAKDSMKLPDERVNTSITCEHGKLVSERKWAKRKYRLVSAEGWKMVRKMFPLASELEYPAGTPPCVYCQEQDLGEMKLKLDRRNAKSAELLNGPSLKGLRRRNGGVPYGLISAHRGALSKGDDAMAGGNCYFLAESRWMSAWRSHHDSSKAHSEPPGVLLNQGLRCRHGAVVLGRRLRLVIEGQLPALGGATEKRKNGDGHGEGEWEGELGEGERMPVEAEVLTREEWRDLARSGYISQPQGEVGDAPACQGGGGGQTGMEATTEAAEAQSAAIAGSEGTGEGAGAGVAIAAGGGGEGGRKRGESPFTFEVRFVPHKGWSPPICEECMAAARDRAEEAKSVFKDKAVNVLRLKEGEDVPQPDPTLTATGLDGGVGVSATGRPQRKTRASGGTAPIVVICSSDETLGFFKLKVYQSAEVIPRRQTLFLKGVPLNEGTATLQEAGVKAGDTLHLKVEETSADDTADGSLVDDTHLFTEGLATKRPPGLELGFAGTALSGGGGRRATPPLDTQASVVAVDVDGEAGAGEMFMGGEGAGGGGGVGAAMAPFVACPMCTFHNELTVEKCSACGEVFV